MTRLPLAGIRVLEFTVAIAGPSVGRYLAHFGAEVIKVESRKRSDNGRRYVTPELPDGDLDLGPSFSEFNANKLSFGLDLSHPKAPNLARRLVPRCDVVLDNYAPRVLEQFGLDYPALRALHPRLIMARMPGQGLTGPRRDFISYGEQIQSLVGMKHLTAFPGGLPSGPGNSYPDFVTGIMGAFAVVTALLHRNATGEGQLIEISQAEGTAAMLGPILMDFLANGHEQERLGNHHSTAAPHSVYPCAGSDRWVAIAVFTDDEWQGLCRALGDPEWTHDPRFATPEGRLAHQDELDRLIAAWTAERIPWEVAAALQREGVPAGAVQATDDLLYRDPHLAARQFFLQAPHLRRGTITFGGLGAKLSGATPRVDWASALMGQHSETVLRDLLGLPEAEIHQLVAERVIDLPWLPDGPPPPELALIP